MRRRRVDKVAGVLNIGRTDDTHEIVISHPALKSKADSLGQIKRLCPGFCVNVFPLLVCSCARLLLFRSFDPVLANPVLANPVLARGDLATADPYDGEVPDPYGGEAEDFAPDPKS